MYGGGRMKYRYSSQILMKFEFFRHFGKNLKSSLIKICPAGADLFHENEQTDMAKLIVAFRKFANALKKLPTSRERV
jgi:NADPH-dependent curcumin reductase CurA